MTGLSMKIVEQPTRRCTECLGKLEEDYEGEVCPICLRKDRRTFDE
ncbi:MAG: hypothetical protein WA584_23655 [Pyrinomonadaceae bacterium]